MGDLAYEYKNQIYVNLTNKCSADCIFCVRKKKHSIGASASLVLGQDPTVEEFKRAISSYDFSNYDGLIFCGYGEPTCEVEKLFAIAKWFKEQYNLPVRVNTNGLGNVYNQRDILPELASVVDAYSISLNAPNAKRYEELVRPNCPDAFEQVLGFAREAIRQKKEVVLSVLSLLSPEEIEQSRQIAKELGVMLKVRVTVQTQA